MRMSRSPQLGSAATACSHSRRLSSGATSPATLAAGCSMDLVLHKEDLLKEILLRLPAKSLLGLKSVCKQWHSVISSDYFCSQHTLRYRPKEQPSLILQHSDHEFFYWNPTSTNGEHVMIPYALSLSVSPDHRYKILQACNGLFLLTANDSHLVRFKYRVYNPTTKLSTEINPPYHDEDDHVAAIGLAFDPLKSSYYKVVCFICSLSDDFTFRVEVYDSESRSWKLTVEQFTHPQVLAYYLRFDCKEARYCNNAIFWWSSNVNAYFSFDIAKNEMKDSLHLPESQPHPQGVCHSHLQELDGRLYYLTLSLSFMQGGSDELLVQLWESRGDEWLLKHRDDRHVISCHDIGQCVKLMGDSDGSLLLIYRQPLKGKMKIKIKMRAYRFLNKKSEDLLDFTAPPFDYSDGDGDEYEYEFDDEVYHAFQFVETLALV